MTASPGLTALEIVAALVEVVRQHARDIDGIATAAADDPIAATVSRCARDVVSDVADLIEREAARLLAGKPEART